MELPLQHLQEKGHQHQHQGNTKPAGLPGGGRLMSRSGSSKSQPPAVEVGIVCGWTICSVKWNKMRLANRDRQSRGTRPQYPTWRKILQGMLQRNLQGDLQGRNLPHLKRPFPLGPEGLKPRNPLIKVKGRNEPISFCFYFMGLQWFFWIWLGAFYVFLWLLM